jgi:lipoate-protein ligase B
MKTLQYLDSGLIDYKNAWDLQKEIFNLRLNNKIEDTLLLLEHPHTYTLGKTAKKEHLLENAESLKEKSISVYNIDRGGDITYHGPGQLVGYPIIDLTNWNKDAHKYLRNLEEVIIMVLKEFNITAGREPKYTGVWVNDNKIAAIGIKISRWITMHGFAFNINPDLSFFSGIIPCGITEKGVTSLEKETGSAVSMEDVKALLVEKFKTAFGYGEIRVLKGNEILDGIIQNNE